MTVGHKLQKAKATIEGLISDLENEYQLESRRKQKQILLKNHQELEEILHRLNRRITTVQEEEPEFRAP